AVEATKAVTQETPFVAHMGGLHGRVSVPRGHSPASASGDNLARTSLAHRPDPADERGAPAASASSAACGPAGASCPAEKAPTVGGGPAERDVTDGRAVSGESRCRINTPGGRPDDSRRPARPRTTVTSPRRRHAITCQRTKVTTPETRRATTRA